MCVGCFCVSDTAQVELKMNECKPLARGGHPARHTRAAWSPDGSRLASAWGGLMVGVWLAPGVTVTPPPMLSDDQADDASVLDSSLETVVGQVRRWGTESAAAAGRSAGGYTRSHFSPT